MTVYGVVRRIHLWAGLVLGAQIILWMLSGVVMSWYDIDVVRGSVNAPPAAPRELEATSYASPGGVITQSPGAYAVELKYFDGAPVYVVSGPLGRGLFNALSGEKLSPIGEPRARDLAKKAFVGKGDIADLSLLDDPPQEYRGHRPVWRAQFDDPRNTRIYIAEDTGEVAARRNDVWRLYDFFWMLHIMDYEERDDFNNWALKIFAAAGLVFTISGAMMLAMRQGRRNLARDVLALTGASKDESKNSEA